MGKFHIKGDGRGGHHSSTVFQGFLIRLRFIVSNSTFHCRSSTTTDLVTPQLIFSLHPFVCFQKSMFQLSIADFENCHNSHAMLPFPHIQIHKYCFSYFVLILTHITTLPFTYKVSLFLHAYGLTLTISLQLRTTVGSLLLFTPKYASPEYSSLIIEFYQRYFPTTFFKSGSKTEPFSANSFSVPSNWIDSFLPAMKTNQPPSIVRKRIDFLQLQSIFEIFITT